MKRFDFEDNDDENDPFEDPNMKSNSHNEIEDEHEFQRETIHLGHMELDQRLMSKAIKICEKSFFWKFYSIRTRLMMISKVYSKFKKILDL